MSCFRILAGLLMLASVCACQPESHGRLGYRRDAFAIETLRGQPVAVYVTGAPTEKAVVFAEKKLADGVDAALAADTAQIQTFLVAAKEPLVRPFDVPLMNSDYRPQPVEQAFKDVVAQVRAKTGAKYLMACVGWVDTAAKDPNAYRWAGTEINGHAGAVKVYVLDVASGQVLLSGHAFVMSHDAARDRVELDSEPLRLDKGVWEDTAELAIKQLKQAR